MPSQRNIDALIAKHIFGWKLSRNYGLGWPPGMKKAESPYKFWIPQYSTQIEYAWHVLEEFPKAELWHDADSEWSCRLVSKKASKWGHADTAPMAICLAALRTVGAIR